MKLSRKLKKVRRSHVKDDDPRYVYRTRSMVWGAPSETPLLDAIFVKMFDESCRKVFHVEDKT